MSRRIECIYPKSRQDWLSLRAPNVNSSQVAGLFGLSPYETPFSLYHRHVGNLVVDDDLDAEAIRWGNRLERPIAEGIAEDRGWKIRKKSEYRFIKAERRGSSYDFEILRSDGQPMPAVFEIKNVFGLAFKNQWAEDEAGNLEAPEWMECQFQNEMDLAERSKLYCGALVSGNKAVVIERDRDESVIRAIQKAVREHWERVDNRQPPAPDYRDLSAIQAMYHNPEAQILDASNNPLLLEFARDHKRYLEAEKQSEQAKKTVQAQIMALIGNSCVKVEGVGYSISCGMVAESAVEAFVRKSYRLFRVSWKKVKSA